MSIGPIEKFLSGAELFNLYPAATLSVLGNGVANGSLHPARDENGTQWFRGLEVYWYLKGLGILEEGPVGIVPDAFEYR